MKASNRHMIFNLIFYFHGKCDSEMRILRFGITHATNLILRSTSDTEVLIDGGI